MTNDRKIHDLKAILERHFRGHVLSMETVEINNKRYVDVVFAHGDNARIDIGTINAANETLSHLARSAATGT